MCFHLIDIAIMTIEGDNTALVLFLQRIMLLPVSLSLQVSGLSTFIFHLAPKNSLLS